MVGTRRFTGRGLGPIRVGEVWRNTVFAKPGSARSNNHTID